MAQVKRQPEREHVGQRGVAEDASRDAHLRLAAEAAGLGFWSSALEGNTFEADAQAKRLHGLPPDATLDHARALAAVHPLDRARVAQFIADAVARRGSYAAEYRVLMPGGGLRWLAARGRVAAGADGHPARLFGVVQDVTERERARALDAERAAHERAERALAHVRLLQRAAAALAVAATAEEVADAMLAESMAALGANGAVVSLLSDDGATYANARVAGYPPEVAAAWARYGAAAPTPIADAVRARELVVLESPVAYAARYPPGAGIQATEGTGARVAIPLLLGARAVGGIGLSFPEARAFDAEERAMLRALGELCAQTLERARLYDAERKARAAAAAERDRLRQVVDVCPEAVVVADAGGRFAILNRRALEFLGEDAQGRPLPSGGAEALARFGMRGLDGATLPDDALPLRRALGRGEGVAGLQMVLRRAADGAEVPALVNSAPLRDEGGAVVGAVAVFQDISALKAADRLKDELLGAAAHDLKRPLTAIRAQAQLLRRRTARLEGLDAARVGDSLDAVERAAARMAAMLDELLDAVRLRDGRPLELERRPADLVALARRVAEDAQRSAPRHRLVVEAAEPALVGVWDPARLERLLANLVDNAVKYSPGGEVVVTVGREGGPDGARAVLTVSDRGIGIPAADLPSIFERYVRGSNAPGRAAGSGLGLFGARRVAEQHGGTIEVESAEGAGSILTVRLPLVQGGPPA